MRDVSNNTSVNAAQGITGYTICLKQMFFCLVQADKQDGLPGCVRTVFTCCNVISCALAVFKVKCFVIINKDNVSVTFKFDRTAIEVLGTHFSLGFIAAF